MEEVNDILESISKHTSAEADCFALNRTIGRGRVIIGNTEQKIWIANTYSQSTYSHQIDRDGRVVNSTSSAVHTYSKDGTVTSKNKAPGRLLMENYSGTHAYKTPRGEMTMEILNTSYYTQIGVGNKVIDLSIGISGKPHMLKFQSLDEALSTYLTILKERSETEDLIANREKELDKKRKEEEEAKIAAQKALDEEERRQREEALKQAQEARRRTEEEIKKHKEDNLKREQLAKEYEETYSFIRMQASLRLNPRLDPSQNAVKFSHIFDGVTTVIDGGPGTGKSTTLIQRMKLLINREDLEDYALNHPEEKLTKSIIDIASERNAWVFFSPTELLCNLKMS